MADELVHYTTDNGVATVTLDSPHNRNALSAQLRRELRDHLATAIGDDAVRVIVLDHTGPVFCAGMDLKEAGNADSSTAGVNEFPEILTRIWTSPKPVVAKLAGPARAGGVGIVAAADIAVAVETATFAFTEVRLGLVPAVISVTVLPRLHPRAAHELLLTGESFDAARAVAIGLINAAVPAEALDAEVDRYTGMLALGGPTALAATKEVLRRARAADIDDEFGDMLELSAGFFAGAEGQEGIRAFAEKRPASWVPRQVQ
ncbi:enoyl-CoA hydratase-related protein [Actinophytocola sp.]|uniref:enoyl-CoA hydratase-related protein n=1 Tax=Actinophytocola sp. TaxID=1872138 RepID=UPI002ED05E6E